MKQLIRMLSAAGLTGVLVAGIYFVFSAVVEQLQDFIWFTLIDTEENKLLVFPLAITAGVLFGFLLKILGEDTKHEANHSIASYASSASQINSGWVLRVLGIGVASLVAGASLGPEAILLPASYGVAFLLAKKFKLPNPAQFGMLGIIVLLAAFFNGYAAAIILLAFIGYKNTKNFKKSLFLVVLGVFAIFISLATLRLLNEREGYVYIGPIGDVTLTPTLFAAAVIIAAVATSLPLLLDVLTALFRRMFDRVRSHWFIAGALAGLGIGVAYYLLGPIGYFSGRSGLGELLTINSELTSLQLAGLTFGKLIVTAWSLATIYRGGFVFPQLLVGMSMALLLSGGIPDSSWLFTLLYASFFGIFTGALGSMLVAAAFVLTLFGTTALPLLVAAAAGSLLIKTIFKKQFASKATV